MHKEEVHLTERGDLTERTRRGGICLSISKMEKLNWELENYVLIYLSRENLYLLGKGLDICWSPLTHET